MAAAMCPVRFMPLYNLVTLYDVTDRRDEALKMAKIIVEKETKVSSHTINIIKQEMQMLIEVYEEADVVSATSENHLFITPKHEDTRQGETPEVQPDGAALPP